MAQVGQFSQTVLMVAMCRTFLQWPLFCICVVLMQALLHISTFRSQNEMSFFFFLTSGFQPILWKHPQIIGTWHHLLAPTPLFPPQYARPLAPPITYFWTFPLTLKIVGFGGISRILILFQTKNCRVCYPFHYPLYSLYVSIHSLYPLFVYVSG